MKPVTEPALIGRINRQLFTEFRYKLRRAKVDTQLYRDFGRYFIVDQHGIAQDCDCDLVDLAKRLGCINADEVLA